MRIYGLIGYPLSHSFSQRYFTEKFITDHINYKVYKNFPLTNISQLPIILEQYRELSGLNVTIPYKEQVLAYVNELDPAAAEIGAVNTLQITRKEGRISIKGFNTDVTGFVESLKPLLNQSHKKALVLGTGGASKAVVYGLRQLGLEVTIVSRKSAEGIRSYQQLTVNEIKVHTVIVNTTPLGMYPNVNEAPDIPYEGISAGHVCYDLVYNPAETLFLKRSTQQGATVENGLKMLHLQAEAAWAIWNA